MVSVNNYGIGTSCSEGRTSGITNNFDYDQKIHGGWRISGISGGKKSTIKWWRAEHGAWVKKVEKNATAGSGWTWMWHCVWIKNYPSGMWRVTFQYDGKYQKEIRFTIKEKPAPPLPPTPPPEPPPEPPTPPPEYPKDISRGPYTIKVDNMNQEIQAKDFLGIEPPGVDLDTYVSKLDLKGLEDWRDYWIAKFKDIGRSFWITFVEDKFNEYKEKLEPPAEPTWWDKIKTHISNILDMIGGKEETQFIYEQVFGVPLSDEEWIKKEAFVLEFIPGLNVFSKLISRKDLAGNPAEFEFTKDAIDAASLALMFIPITRLPIIGKLLGKVDDGVGLLGVADDMALKKATPAQIEAILKADNFRYVMSAIRKEPALWAKIMPHLDDPTRAILFASMKKMSDPTAFRLAADAVKTFEATKGLTLWQKAFGALPGKTKARKGVIAISTVLGTIGAYIGLAQFLAHTGREAIADAVGFGAIWTNIDAGNWKQAATYLPLYKSAIDSYEKSTILASTIPFLSGIWEDAVISIRIAYEAEKELIETELAKIEERGTLRVFSNVENSDVYIDGAKKGTTPFTIELDVGTYHILVTKFQYDSTELDVDIVAGATPVFNAQIFPAGEFPPELELPEIVWTTVRDIIDGDTIDTSLDYNPFESLEIKKFPEYGTTGHARIRILGINAPEKSPKGEILCTDIEVYQVQKSWADESKNVLLPLNDKLVKLYIDPEKDVDTHGRILAKVEYGGIDVGLEQIKRGLACWYFRETNKYVDDEEYKAATLKAQEDKTGMWSDLPEQPGLPPEAKITFSIDSAPSNAPVFIDGIATHHNTPTDNVEQEDVWSLWSEGKHILKITKSGMVKEQEIDLIPGEHLELVVDLTALPEEEEPPEEPPEEEEPPEPPIPEEPEEKDKLIEDLRNTLAELNKTIKILNARILELEGMPPTPPPEEPPVAPPTIPPIYTPEQFWALTTAFSELWDFIKDAAQLSKPEFNIFKASYDLYSDDQKKVLNIFFDKVWDLTKGVAQMSHKEYDELKEEFRI